MTKIKRQAFHILKPQIYELTKYKLSRPADLVHSSKQVFLRPSGAAERYVINAAASWALLGRVANSSVISATWKRDRERGGYVLRGKKKKKTASQIQALSLGKNHSLV